MVTSMLDINDYSSTEEFKKELFSDDKQTLLLAKVVSLSMAILGIIMAITTYIEGNHAMVVVSLIYGPLFLIAFIVSMITKKAHFFLALYIKLCYGVCLSDYRWSEWLRYFLDVYNHSLYLFFKSEKSFLYS